MKKNLSIFLFAICFLLLGTNDAKAMETSNLTLNDNTISPRATRYNFDWTIKTFSSNSILAARQNGNYKYIRVRLEPGTTGDTVDLSAIAGFTSSVSEVTLATKTISLKSIPMIIDFRAKNAPCRDDATVCVVCDVKSGYSSADYCVVNSSVNYVGIKAYNGALLGNNARLYGGYSLEN
ncbi:MAG: hypothetical protein NC181_01320 [Clostridium sp.]|nr:hypothetical protein [Clostridium sp.]MCM1443982.1 hypothetical protein [Candidatus Amulumruptor caecigallinarius]